MYNRAGLNVLSRTPDWFSYATATGEQLYIGTYSTLQPESEPLLYRTSHKVVNRSVWLLL